MHADQHLVSSDLGLVDLLESQDVVGFAVLVLDDRLHRLHTGGDVGCVRWSVVLVGLYRLSPVRRIHHAEHLH
jgi:hypothetical protein